MPLLWLCGPPGVGKTTVGWEIFRELGAAAVASAYIDIDQLGICYPALLSDPERHRLKAQNLGLVAATFARAGARCMVVSGVVDPAAGAAGEPIPGVAITLCRLRAEPETLSRRLAARGVAAGDLEAALCEAAAMDRLVAHACVDTSGRPVSEVVRLVRERTGGWPAPRGAFRWRGGESVPRADRRAADGTVLLVCGAVGVGKSRVGWALYEAARRAGRAAAFVDLRQIGLLRLGANDRDPHHRVRAQNVGALWRTYRATGARHLVAVGAVEDAASASLYRRALAPANVTLCRLHAGAEEFRARILRRGLGENWEEPGDPLRGRPQAQLRRIAEGAARTAAALERARLGDLRIDTDGLVPEAVAARIAMASGWPGPDD
jgi:adenylylsulfate kinase-like enzyme